MRTAQSAPADPASAHFVGWERTIFKTKYTAVFGCAAIVLVLAGYAAQLQPESSGALVVNEQRAAYGRHTPAAVLAEALDTATATSAPTFEPTAIPTDSATALPAATRAQPASAKATRAATATTVPATVQNKAQAAMAMPANVAAPAPAAAPAACGGGTGQTFASLSVSGPPAERPAALHADLNLGLRGWVESAAPRLLMALGGPADPGAPKFPSLFAPRHMPAIAAAYAVYNWDFDAGRRTQPVVTPPVSLLGLTTMPGEPIHLPAAGYDIGEGQSALVLYAAPSRITLKYTREDNVANGYTLHLENVCVAPQLLALYQTLDAAGRRRLPGLRIGQPFGSAAGSELIVGIQDSGAWMDPRALKDWWQ